MEIKVLGAGCAKCKKLEKVTYQAVDELGIEATIEKVEDMIKIMEFGVMATPALVVNDKVIVSGRVPKISEIKNFLTL